MASNVTPAVTGTPTLKQLYKFFVDSDNSYAGVTRPFSIADGVVNMNIMNAKYLDPDNDGTNENIGIKAVIDGATYGSSPRPGKQQNMLRFLIGLQKATNHTDAD